MEPVKDVNFVEDMIRNRISETLIEQLFLITGYDVFNYDIKNSIPGIAKLLSGVDSETAKELRRMPDFVVRKGDDIFFVEVKFVDYEDFSFSDIPKHYPFHNCHFILVSRQNIKCITYNELKKGDKISPSDNKFLSEREEFKLNKKVITDFSDFAVKVFYGL